MANSKYRIDIPSLYQEFPPTIPVPPLLVEFAEWLSDRDLHVGWLELYGDRLDDLQASGLGDLYDHFAPFIRTPCGSIAALWLPEGVPLPSPPVVLIGSEGECLPLGSSLEDFLWRLARRETWDHDLDDRDGRTVDGGPELSRWLESRNIQTPDSWTWPDFASWWDERQKAFDKWCDSDSIRLDIADKLRIIRPFAPDEKPWQTMAFDAVIVGTRFQMWQRQHGPKPMVAAAIAELEPLLRADRERRADEIPSRGLWFQSWITVSDAGGAHLSSDFMREPNVGDERIEIPLQDYRADLTAFPRSAYWMPDWLKSRVEGIG